MGPSRKIVILKPTAMPRRAAFPIHASIRSVTGRAIVLIEDSTDRVAGDARSGGQAGKSCSSGGTWLRSSFLTHPDHSRLEASLVPQTTSLLQIEMAANRLEGWVPISPSLQGQAPSGNPP